MSSAFKLVLPKLFGKDWWDAFPYSPRIMHQSFGMLLLDSDLQSPRITSGRLSQPRTKACVAKSGFSEVAVGDKEFRIKLDTTDFKPEEVQVKVVGKFVEVHGKHEERIAYKDGTVAREFKRRYILPEGCDGEDVAASWDPEGYLVITVPRKLKGVDDEREVLIKKPKEKVQVQTEAAEKPKEEVQVQTEAAEKPKEEAQVQTEAAEKPKEGVQVQACSNAEAAERPKEEDQKQTETTEELKEEVQKKTEATEKLKEEVQKKTEATEKLKEEVQKKTKAQKQTEAAE